MGSTDYQGNAKKKKEEQGRPLAEDPEKQALKKALIEERAIKGEVVAKKRSIGRKFKDTFIAADFGSVMRYVVGEVLIPAARNMIVDASRSGIERLVYGESRRYRGVSGESRYQYNRPVERTAYSGISSRFAPPVQRGPRSRHTRDDIIVSTREDGESVLEVMNEIVDRYGMVSIADMNELVGLPIAHTDQKWGWTDLRGASIVQIREGYLIEFPPVEEL